MRMHLSWQSLRVFESAARHGSFKLAADELALSPTAVSHHIIKLEKRLNLVLFERLTRQVKLTQAGETLAAAATTGFRQIEQAVSQIMNASTKVRITTTSSLAALVLVPALKDFLQQNPLLDVEITSGEALDQSARTLPIRYGKSSDSAASDILKHERFNAYIASKASNNLSTANLNQPVSIITTELKNKSLPQPPLQRWLDINALDQQGFDIKDFDQELFGVTEAIEGNGLVFASTTLVQRAIEQNELIPLDTQSVDSELCYYLPNRNSYTSTPEISVIQWIEQLLNRADSKSVQ